jgi:hypothetical protein
VLLRKEFDYYRSNKFLKGLASSELFTTPKGYFPRALVCLNMCIVASCYYIREVYVAFLYISILAKYRINSFWKLGGIRLINIAGIYPEVFQFISCGLFRAELYLPSPSIIYSLTHVHASLDILKNDLLFSPGMREYCVGRDIAASRFAKDDLAIRFALQEAYERHARGLRPIS